MQTLIPASNLPRPYLNAAITKIADLAIKHNQRFTLVGYRGGEVIICRDGCRERESGSYTIIPDLEVIEIKANGGSVLGNDETGWLWDRPNGRSALVVGSEML